jgi:predicted nucleotidyltransferase
MSAIRRFARRIAEKFDPEKIILFGSFAYGTPHEESDVDLLVVMPAREELTKAARIQLAFEPVFPLDILVRTPQRLRRRLAEGDSFLQEVVSKGIVLYEKSNPSVDSQSRKRLGGRSPRSSRRRPTQGPGQLSLPAMHGEVPQGAPPGSRVAHSEDP